METVHELFEQPGDGEPPVSPKQYTIGPIGVDLFMLLNYKWHSLLPETVRSNLTHNKDKVFYAAIYKNRYYAVAAWTSPISQRVKDIESTLELRRFAIAPEACRNTASHMLAYMRKDIAKKFPHIRKLISYQDTVKHHGTIYKADNWKRAENVSEWTPRPDRIVPQTTAPKIRWEYLL